MFKTQTKPVECYIWLPTTLPNAISFAWPFS